MTRLDDKLDLAHATGIWASLKRNPHEGVWIRIGARETLLPAAQCEIIERALLRDRTHP